MPGTNEPAPRLPAAGELPSITLKHGDCNAILEMKALRGAGQRAVAASPHLQRGASTQKLKGLRTLTECRRMLTNGLTASLQCTLISSAKVPVDPAPLPKELCGARQAPIVYLPCGPPSRPLKPQFPGSVQQVSPHSGSHRKQRVSKAPCCTLGLPGPLPLPQVHGGRS